MFLAAHELQAVFCGQLQRLDGGHGLAHQCRNAGPDGFAHHIHRYAAAGVDHALADGENSQKHAAHGLVQRIVASDVLAGTEDAALVQHKAAVDCMGGLIKRKARAHGGGEGLAFVW